MSRLIAAILCAVILAAAAPLPDAAPLHPSAAFEPAGPRSARGAFVWLHGGYDTDEFPNGPPEPGWVRRLANSGYDIWRFDRPERDPLTGSSERLATGLHALRAGGYQRIVVGGQSRGAFVALSLLHEPGLADALALLDPAAHGTSPKMRDTAMAAFRERVAGADGRMRVAYVTLADDPFDFDPEARIAMLRAAATHAGMPLLVIDRPPEPRGHMGSFDPAFDIRFGPCLAEFLDGKDVRC